MKNQEKLTYRRQKKPTVVLCLTFLVVCMVLVTGVDGLFTVEYNYSNTTDKNAYNGTNLTVNDFTSIQPFSNITRLKDNDDEYFTSNISHIEPGNWGYHRFNITIAQPTNHIRELYIEVNAKFDGGASLKLWNSTDWEDVQDSSTSTDFTWIETIGLINSSRLLVNFVNETTSLFDVVLLARSTSGGSRTIRSDFVRLLVTIPLIENGHTFNTNVYEASTQDFEANVTYDNLTYPNIEGVLVYNNTRYTGTKSEDGGNLTFTRTIEVPQTPSDDNFTFYWEFTLTNSTETLILNSSFQTQTIKNLTIDNCTSNTALILNYTLFDEEDQTQLAGVAENTSMQLDINIFSPGNSTPFLEFSQNYYQTNPAQVCLNDDLTNLTYQLDATMFYTSQDRVTEYHHLQNFTLTNTSIPQLINLLNLETTKAQEFLILFKDDNFLVVEDALIDITRFYVDEGVFKTVELPKTDSSGQTLAHFNIDDNIIYSLVVSKNGVTLATFSNVIPVCDDATTGDCTINLNALTTGTEILDWETFQGVSHSMTFDKNTKIITVTFTTNDGSSAVMLLNATKFDRFGNDTVCFDTLTSSSGTLTCTIPDSYGNVTVLAELSKDGEIIATNIYEIQEDPSEIFGDTSVFLFILFMLTIPMMFMPSTIAMVVGAILSVIFASLLSIINLGGSWGTTSALIWLIVAGAIIIFKLAQRKGS